MIICKMCGKTIRNVPGKEGMVFEDICPACKAGGVTDAPSRLNSPAVPAVVSASIDVPPKPAVRVETVDALSPHPFVDLVVAESAKQVTKQLMDIFRRGMDQTKECGCGETKKEDTGGEARAPAALVDEQTVPEVRVEEDVPDAHEG